VSRASAPPAQQSRIALAVLALAALAHCGRKTDVRPPELVAPEVVESVKAENVTEGINVSWRRPEKYVDGSRMTDLAGFRIERSRDGEPFAAWQEKTVDDRERFRKTRRFRILDTDVEMGREYRYRVRAFTLDDDVSADSKVAGIVRQAPEEKRKSEGAPQPAP
jgi:hypothetical protein